MELTSRNEIDHGKVAAIQHLLSRHDWDRAKDLCFCLLKTHRDAEVLNLLGFACFQSGDYEKAIQHCMDAHAIGIDDWSNQFIVGLCWKTQGNLRKAIDAFQIAYSKENLSVDVVIEILRCLLINGDLISWRDFYDRLHDDLKNNQLIRKESENFRELELVSHIKECVVEGRFIQARRYAKDLLRLYPRLEYHRLIDHVNFYTSWSCHRNRTVDCVDRRASLSVLVITYNHEKFIARALDSILEQATNYKINIVVMEDCSTDSTAAVVKDYERRYPEIISAHCNNKNVGTLDPPQQKVTFRGLELLVGDYFAILEGDDYWSSRDKVETQIEFLEKNAFYVACAHNTMKVYEDTSFKSHRFLYWEGTKTDHNITDMIIYSFFHSSSMVFRNFFRGDVPEYFKSKWSCDIFMSVFATQFGNIRYFDQDMSVYRAHSGGSYSNLSLIKGDIFNINGYIHYNYWLKFRYFKEFSFQIARRCALLRQREGFANLDLATKTKYAVIGAVARTTHSVLDRWPAVNPSVWYHKEPVR